jgi:uncharacterized Zn finger protein (UPF0148 family)
MAQGAWEMNTDKFSVLIKYKYLDYIHEANLSKTDSWNLIEAIIEYDRSEKEPEFENPILIGLFTVIKIDLNENKKKWAETIEKRREAGKKGAEQKKQMSAKEANADFACDIKKIQANQATKAVYDLDLDLDLDLEYEFDGGGDLNNPVEKSENLLLAQKPPPPTDIKIIQEEAAQHGFFIDTDACKKCLNSNLDHDWILGPHSFIGLAAERVKEFYPDKSKKALKSLFIDAVLTWDDLRLEYPLWRKEQKQAAIKKKEQKNLETAAANKPTHCPKCGIELIELKENLFCSSCGGSFVFEDKSMQYIFSEREGMDFTAGFQNELKRRRAIG